MGIAKQAALNQQQHDDLSSALNGLMKHERIKHPVGLGIAKLVADKGVSSLSGGQIRTYETYVVPELSIECAMCGTKIPLMHVTDVLDNEFEEGELLCMGCCHLKHKES